MSINWIELKTDEQSHKFLLLNSLSAKFAIPCSLRSHRIANPTQKNGYAIILLCPPATHKKKGNRNRKNKRANFENHRVIRQRQEAGSPAGNERFCKMAAVSPQTILCGIERLSPAGTFVEAATSQSRQHVSGNGGTAQCVIEKEENAK